jgi:hypothetical protein
MAAFITRLKANRSKFRPGAAAPQFWCGVEQSRNEDRTRGGKVMGLPKETPEASGGNFILDFFSNPVFKIFAEHQSGLGIQAR